MNRSDIIAIIRNRAQAYGLDPATMIAIGGVESNLDPANANPSSSARGLYQFMTRPGGSWSEYGRGGDVLDPMANADAAMRYTKDNIDYFHSRLGRTPTPGETYLMHQQGRAGGVALLSDPTKNVVDVLRRFYSPEMAANAVTQNGGRTDMTAGEFASLWNQRLNRNMTPAAGDQSGQQTGAVTPAVQGAAPQPSVPQQGGLLGNIAANTDEKKLTAALTALKGVADSGNIGSQPVSAPQMQLGPTPYAQALRSGILSGYLRS